LRFQPGFDPTGGQVPMALLVTMMAVACFAEDLLYRGYAFVALQRRHGVAVAALVTSLGYALLTPGPELPLKIWAFGFGIVLAGLRQRTESLWPVVGLHYATSLLPRLALEWGG
ncbi:MAG: CPBP family intramembrane glutamic endopeptidase, partial [Myxococcota bacterium]